MDLVTTAKVQTPIRLYWPIRICTKDGLYRIHGGDPFGLRAPAILSCHERIYTEDSLYRIHGGDPFGSRAPAIVDTDEIEGLVGVVYRETRLSSYVMGCPRTQ